ncbi:MAG: adenosylcobinamide-GDP ribazoletransferase [Streptosporangiaceae bacterium]
MPWAGLRLATTLLTALPLRGRGPAPTRRTAAAAMMWAPVIGLLLGALAAAVLEVAVRLAGLGPLAGAVLAVAALAAATRALHLDGLADLADGLGSRAPAAAALAIMRRSDIGPFGVVTLLLTVLVQVTALARAAALGRGPAAVIIAAAAARLAMTWACARGGPAAGGSRLGVLVAGTVRPAAAAALTAVLLAAAALAGAAGLAPGPAGRWLLPAGAAAGLAAGAALTRLAVRRLGGITGDVLGAVAEISAAACLLVTAIR